MVKRSSSPTSPAHSSNDDTRPFSLEKNTTFDNPNEKSTSPKKKKKSDTKSKESWTPEKRQVAIDMVLEAGFNAVDFKLMREKTGLTTQQLRDGLRKRNDNLQNLRAQVINLIGSK